MSHPFELKMTDLEKNELEFERQLTDEEVESIGGGLSLGTTQALGEEGGFYGWPPIGDRIEYPLIFPVSEDTKG